MRIIIRGLVATKDQTDLVKFVATNKIDPRNEHQSPRPLFSLSDDSLTTEHANIRLSGDNRTPRKDLFHLLISLRPEDYCKLGITEYERNRAFRAVIRAGMVKGQEVINADELNWVAGIHHNTSNPHAHVAIWKQYRNTKHRKEMRMESIPYRWLPKTTGEGNERQIELRPFIQTLEDKMSDLQSLSHTTHSEYWETIGAAQLDGISQIEKPNYLLPIAKAFQLFYEEEGIHIDSNSELSEIYQSDLQCDLKDCE